MSTIRVTPESFLCVWWETRKVNCSTSEPEGIGLLLGQCCHCLADGERRSGNLGRGRHDGGSEWEMKRTVVDVDQNRVGLKYKRGVMPDVGCSLCPNQLHIGLSIISPILSHSHIYFTMYSK